MAEDAAMQDGELPSFVPSRDGYAFTLPDDVDTFVRMRHNGESYVAEWCLANRNIEIPAGKDILRRVRPFVDHCSKVPHRVLVMSDKARGAFLSYATHYNILVKKARDDCDADAGAEYGTSPWKLGMLSGSLLLWDILWGVVTPSFREEQWTIDDNHVERAFALMSILDGIRTAFRAEDAPTNVAPELDAPDQNPTLPDRELPGVAHLEGAKTTEVARRMLSKATAKDEQGVHAVHATKVWGLFTSKEKTSRGIGALTAHLFRDVAKQCPLELGGFDATEDSLVITVPEEITEAFTAALMAYANMTPSHLKTALGKNSVSTRGGARKKRAAA